MKKISATLVLVVFILGALAMNSQGTIASTNSATGNPFPLGNASIDFSFALKNQMTTQNPATGFTNQVGKTIYYDLNVNNFPLVNVLNTLYGSNVSSIFTNFNIDHTQLFIKVLRQDGNNIDMVMGIRLANNLEFNLTPIFNAANLPTYIQNLIIPKGLQVLFPGNIMTENNPYSQNTNNLACNNYNYYYNTPCNVAVSPIGLYINPSNYTGAQSAVSTQLSNLQTDTGVSWTNYFNATAAGVSTYSPDQYSQYNYLTATVPSSGNITSPVPLSYVYGIYSSSTYSFSLAPYLNSALPVTPIINSTSPYSSFFGQKAGNIISGLGSIVGQSVVIPFQADGNLYANGNNLYVPGLNIASVSGVYYERQVNYASYSQLPSGLTNLYSGGAITGGDNIALNTVPSQTEPLVIYYTSVTQPTLFTHNSLTASNYAFGFNLSSTTNPLAYIYTNANWNLASSSYSGWMNNFDFKLGFDANNNGAIDPSTEVFDVSLVLNQTASYYTPNPLAVGDAGTYSISSSSFNANLDTAWQTLWNSNMPNSTTDLHNFFSSLQGKKLLDYHVTGIDGLYYTVAGNNYDPTQASNPLVGTYDLGSSGTVFNAFNGFVGSNITTSSVSMNCLCLYSNNQLKNYYNTALNNPNVMWTADRYGSPMVAQNVTITDLNYLDLSVPYSPYNTMYVFNATTYNTQLAPWQQNPLTSATFSSYNVNVNASNQISLSYFPYPVSSGAQFVIVYYPDQNLNAINGKVYIPSSVDIQSVNNVYFQNYNSQVSIPGLYVGQDVYNTNPVGSLSGKVITLSSSTPQTQMYEVNVYANVNTFYGDKVYTAINTPGYGMILPTLTNPFGYVLPARTAGDFQMMQSDVNVLNTLSNDMVQPAVNYIQNYLNDPANGIRNSLTSNLSLSLTYGANLINSNGWTLEYNATGSAVIPAKVDNNLFTVNTLIDASAKIGFQAQWDTNGILKNVGVNIHLQISSAGPSSTTTTSTSSSTSTTTINAGSPGFELVGVLLVMPVIVAIRYRSRKKNN